MNARPTELPPPGAADVLYLIDLSGYVFRAFHALPPMNNRAGEPTNATYGMVTMLAKLVEDRKPAYLAVAMDMAGGTFRDAIDARYKAHRPAPPPELSRQMARCREIVEAYRIPIFSGQGLEADDFIAVAVARARAQNLRVVIAAADKDLMQLVDEHVVMWDAMRIKTYGVAEVTAKFGVPPSQLRDFLALVGDTSDNVPGVPGVGNKTAAELLGRFGTIEDLYANLDQVKKNRIRESLREHEADARVSQRLVTLRDDAPIDLDLDTLRYGGGADSVRLREIFTELEFTRFIKAVPPPAAITGTYRAVTTRPELEAFVAEARASGRLSIEVLATSREVFTAAVCGVALSCKPGDAIYVPTGHRYLGAPAQLGLADVEALVGPLLADPAIAKVGHDLKFVEVTLGRFGMPLRGVTFDTMLASYLLEPEESNALPDIAQRDGGVTMVAFEQLAPKQRGKTQRTLDEIEVDHASSYAAAYADVALQLSDRYAPKILAAGLDPLLRKLEIPLASVLAEMERVGVLIDPPALEELGKEMAKELAALEEKARAAAGQDLNLASPKQLETVLFDDLRLRSTRRTKTGRSTDADALEAIADEHPLPALVLEHRMIAKLKGTYVDALPRLVHPTTGRIHGRWSQAVAATGRISSQDPNLQNIPIRTALGKLIRRAFIAPPGKVLLSADYSQIELRVLAHLSKDTVLVDAFENGQDVHVRTAMEIFGVDAAGVTEEMRRQSKTINFGVIYGMGDNALARKLGIPRAEASRFIEAYFQRYHGVNAFMEQTMAEARKTETVRTILGRLRHLADLRSADRMRRAYSERIAQNTPIQGSAADLLKLAMVKLGEPVVSGARMVLTVHDELAFEVPAEAADEAAAKIKAAMEEVFPLDVPLVVDVAYGPTWADT